MAKHAPGFLKLVNEARKWIVETTVQEIKARLDRGEPVNLIDVREDSEYDVDHIPGSIHIGKGVLERDIESKFPDTNTELVLYCGGGYRSALAAEALARMGYQKIISMDGGIRGWREANYPLEQGPAGAPPITPTPPEAGGEGAHI